jgi:pSer/pThr/pTyr-binding forkhead associated (FHA) protein
MFAAPAPTTPTVSATPISPVSPSPRSTGLQRGISFFRNYTHGLHLHSADTTDGPREDARARPRASTHTHTPPVSPFAASAPSQSASARPSPPSRRQTEPRQSQSQNLNLQSPANDSPPLSPQPLDMTRTRAETAAPQLSVRNSAGPTPTTTNPTRSTDHDSSSDHAADGSTPQKHLPSIRFIPHQDPRAGRPSLQFPTITRTLPDESAVIRVGRYSERDNAPEIPANTPSAAAIGFKSKVVSRKHCELWCKDGSWFIKDVKSSSGTFLNHIRLSQPNVESKPFRIKDGDIIQLGIDFRGGEEMIFRCVKIRVECNRGWQQALNTFKSVTFP